MFLGNQCVENKRICVRNMTFPVGENRYSRAMKKELSKMQTLLTDHDPAAYWVENRSGPSPVVITCDHASNKVPSALNGLGLDQSVLDRHVGYDIGTIAVATALAKKLNAPAIFSGYSRLVMDLNRPVDDFTSIRAISDGEFIPANRYLNDAEKQVRHVELFKPYHDQVAEIIEEKIDGEKYPILISVHSCTDIMNDIKRPWHVGVLTNHDRRVGEALIAVLEERFPDMCVGDNKPYSGWDPYGFTLENHAVPRGLPNVLLEIRQDLIKDAEGESIWAEKVGSALETVLADQSLYCKF